MRKIIFALALGASLSVSAQLKVAVECAVKEGDITGYRLNDQKPIVMDGDTIPFALVRVGLTEPDAVFDSKWALKQEFIDNEYWVYFMEGTKSVTVKTKRFTPLHYKFSEPLQARNTYTMTIHKPDGAKYNGNLHITSNVPTAEIYVDGSKVSDGTPFTYSGEGGMHRIELRAPGYDPQTREIDVPMGQSRDININLFAEGSLSVDGVSYGMVPVAATSYTMGGPLNYYSLPARNVSLRPFSAGSTFVSVDLWEKVMGEADDRIKGPSGRVVNVSYDEVSDFISALNAKTGRQFRLPTEAEWEYIAQHSIVTGIADIREMMEWCSDWFGKYSTSDTVNPTGAESGVLRSVRGGSEYTDRDPCYNDIRFRWRKQPDRASKDISFRIVEDI